jgi:hypothetical protein
MAQATMPTDGPGFDPEALRDKYRIERDRRLRQDGSTQYIRTTGRFAHYLDDPYSYCVKNCKKINIINGLWERIVRKKTP